MKTRLNDFLSEGRSQFVDPQKIHSLKVSRGYVAPKVFRGIQEASHTTLRVDPRTSTRRSANTSNYYTLWMDNDKAWRSFPNRSKSIICTTSYEKATQYATSNESMVYAVWPEEEYTSFGVCPTPDLWTSFECSVHPEYTTRWRDGELFKTPRSFAEFIKEIAPDYSAKRNASWICNMLYEMGVKDDTYSSMVKSAKESGMYEWIRFVFDPVGFRKTKFEDLTPYKDNKEPRRDIMNMFERGNEVWTSGLCVMEEYIRKADVCFVATNCPMD